MRNNLWDKKFIKSDGVHDLFRNIGWLTRVHMIFYLFEFYVFNNFFLQY